jgi:hypothetical protein
MKATGQVVAEAIDNLTSSFQLSATTARNEAFLVAGKEFLESHVLDSNPSKVRNLMTRFRGDSKDDLARNRDTLLAEYPELASFSGLENLTMQLSKVARPVNRAVSIERVRSSIVRSVIRPLFFEYPLEKLARETGKLTGFNQQRARIKSQELIDEEISLNSFQSWTRAVFELFQETSVMRKEATSQVSGFRMPGIVNELNIRRYTNVWFDFTGTFCEQIIQLAKGKEHEEQSKVLDPLSSRPRLGPRYSSVGSSFNYSTLGTPELRISVLLSRLGDPSIKATKDWDSKESFDKEIQSWVLGVLEMMSISDDRFSLEVRLKFGSNQTGLEITEHDALTACAKAKKFLSLSF